MQKNDSFIGNFLKLESASGILLMLSAALAMVCANSPLSKYYNLLLDVPVAVQFGALVVAKPLLLWINDGLMAIFFLLVGLELKRELLEGELSEVSNIILPAVGAIGGMLCPALVYIGFNHGDDVAMKGWAIPAATDIAFALGVLALLGSRVPSSVKIFLTSLAIFDDIGAIIIIAIFYTEKMSVTALIVALFCVLVLFVLNRKGVISKTPYMLIGMVMWVAMLKSGVHATLAGVLLAAFVPLQVPKHAGQSPAKSLENDLHSSVAFVILPIFAFANAGISFLGLGLDQVLHPVPTGIALGLLIGKQLGVFGFCVLAIRLGVARLPQGMNWKSLYGTAILCGIGFTMSLFISSLAFEETEINRLFDDRLGIVIGSLLSGVLGYIVIRASLEREAVSTNEG